MNTQRKCRVCGQLRDVYKMEFKDRTHHLVILCTHGTRKKPERIFIPFEEIEASHLDTRKQANLKREAMSISLF